MAERKLTFPGSMILGQMLTIFSLTMLGCIDKDPSPSKSNYPQLKVLGILYGHFLRENNQRPPKSRDELIAYLERIPDEWKPLGFASAEEFLVSPRDEKPMKIVTGKQFGPQSSSGLPWVAYEQSGKDGKYLAIDARGSTKELTETELRKIFP